MNYVKLLEQNTTEGKRFQEPLGEFIFEHKLELLVETGSGVSTLFLLKALDKSESGKLYSIDPEPFCQFEVQHSRYELIKKKSFQALADLYIETGAWDFFLHDSDHWIETQMFEYEIAFQCVRNGGWIFSDDYQWDGHGAWKRFCEKYNLQPVIVGDICGAQKVSNEIIDPNYIKQYSEKVWQGAKNWGKKWRQQNGRPPCWSCESEVTEYWKFPETK